MRWKKIEILPFSIHNAFGYTSSASQARHLPLKGKALRGSANIDIQFIMLFSTTHPPLRGPPSLAREG
jgi:hypothetical protein